MKRRVNVIGVGMTKFAKPGASSDYQEMAREVGLKHYTMLGFMDCSIETKLA